MASMFDTYEEAAPKVLTPGEMRAALRSAAERRPEEVYGSGCPKGHVAAVLAGDVEPLPALLEVLELREERGGYVSTREPEPWEPDAYTWPDGRPFTAEDEAEIRLCLREVRGAETGHEDVSGAISMALGEYDAAARDDAHTRGFSVAFLAGAAWAQRRARKQAAG